MEKTAVEKVSAAGGSDDALRTRGLRLTGPRRVVLEVVRGTDSHPTAERVHAMVRRRLPRVSLGTVYRNLRLLVAAGLVNELPGPHARFDGNVSDHHHFTCLGCGRIADVAGAMTEPHSRALCLRVAAQSGLSVSHHRIDFYGRCPDCRESSGNGPPHEGRRRGCRAPMSARAEGRAARPKSRAVNHVQPDRKGESPWQEPQRYEEPRESEGRIRGRVSGQSPLSLLRAGRRHRRLPGHRGPLQGHRGCRDGPRVRTPRFSERGGGPRHR